MELAFWQDAVPGWRNDGGCGLFFETQRTQRTQSFRSKPGEIVIVGERVCLESALYGFVLF
jgi:hypothetical protein